MDGGYLGSFERRRRLFLLMSGLEWLLVGTGALVAVIATATVRDDVAGWPAAGLMLTGIVFGHLCVTAGRHVAFPDLVGLASCLQWIVAPWLAETYRPRMLVFRMVLAPEDYLAYAVPATLALWLGLQLPVARALSDGWSSARLAPLSKRVQTVLDAAIGVGLVLDLYSEYIPIEWRFLGYLIASFRFFGALGWMVTRTPGWWIRVGIVLLELTVTEAAGGLFYLIVHWSGYFLIVYAFMSRWRWQLAVALLAGAVTIGVLQDIKPAYRTVLSTQETSDPIDSLVTLGRMMWARVQGEQIGEPRRFGDTLVRFNQGWIIARVMRHVPDEQPYAGGETLIDAAVFSVVPRFLVPWKRQGASVELFTKYTGVALTTSTKMGLGVVGEMYANFSYLGGILGTFVYGCLLGWIFKFFAARALQNPLWWAAAAMILLPGVEPGFNIEDIANHVVKAAVVFFVLWKFFPPMQHLLAIYEEPHTLDDEHDGEIAPSFDEAAVDHR
jgi:hypothetical protein